MATRKGPVRKLAPASRAPANRAPSSRVPEGSALRPDIVVCLGAIAARNVIGTKFGLMKQRGTWQPLPDGSRGFATVHPSWVLRQRDSATRESAMRGFVADLALLLYA